MDDYIAGINWDEVEHYIHSSRQHSHAAAADAASVFTQFSNSCPASEATVEAQELGAVSAADLLKATAAHHGSDPGQYMHHAGDGQAMCSSKQSYQSCAPPGHQPQQQPFLLQQQRTQAAHLHVQGQMQHQPSLQLQQHQHKQQQRLQGTSAMQEQQQRQQWHQRSHHQQQQQRHHPQQQQQQWQQRQHPQQQHANVWHQQAHQQHPTQQQQHHLAPQQQHQHQEPAALMPRCPYKACPGLFSLCGAALRWIERGKQGFWGCILFPHCEYRYFPAQQVSKPELGCEVVDETCFRLVPQPAAEVAVARAGGIRAVLAKAGISLAHLELPHTAGTAAPGAATATAAWGTNHQPSSGGTAASCTLGSTIGASSADCHAGNAAAASEPALAATPDWSWPPEHCIQLRLSDYELVAQLLLGAKPPLMGRGGAIPSGTLTAFREPAAGLATDAEVQQRYAAMPTSLRTALLPFQAAGVWFGLARRGRVLIADEMGVGKTVQALALAACYQDEWPLLVVVPASLRLVWAEELERWLPHVRPGSVTVIEGKEDRLSDLPEGGRKIMPAITITSYEMLKRLSCSACQKLSGAVAGVGGGGRGRGRGKGAAGSGTGGCTTGGAAAAGGTGSGCAGFKHSPNCTGPDRCMAALPWGVVIIDESHNLRTTNSRQADSPHTEAAVAAGGAAKRLMLLSGTPSLSRPYDLYRQVDVLVPGLLGRSKEEFAHRYCDRRLVPVVSVRGEQRMRWDNAGGARLVELHGLLKRRVMIRRLKKDVMAELPPKRRQVVRLPYPHLSRWPPEPTPAAADNTTAAAAVNEDLAAAKLQLDSTGAVAAAAARSTRAAGQHEYEAESNEPGAMTAPHRTALAKLPDAIDWLLAAVGIRRSSGSSSSKDDDSDADDDQKGFQNADSGSGCGISRSQGRPRAQLKSSWGSHRHNSSTCNAAEAVAGEEPEGPGGSSSAAEFVGDCDSEEHADGMGGMSAVTGSDAGGASQPKFLVFAHHRDVMDKLAAALSGYSPDLSIGSSNSLSHGVRGVGYVRVDGSHDSQERLAAVQRFRSDPLVRVALLSITAAAVGLDFSSASMVVFVELPNEVSLVRQAEDRAHRKGQQKAVNVYFLCAQGTVDDRKWQALNLSLCNISQVHDGEAETLPQPLVREDSHALGAASEANKAANVAEYKPAADADGMQQQQQQQGVPTAGASSGQLLSTGSGDVEASLPNAQQQPSGSQLGVVATPQKQQHDQQQEQQQRQQQSTQQVDEKAGAIDFTAESPVKKQQFLTAMSSPNRPTSRGHMELTPTPTKADAQSGGAPNKPYAADQPTDGKVSAASQLQRRQQDAPPEPAPPEVWFEISGYTNRLHYHLASDGRKPLGLNLPLDWLLLPEDMALQQLAQAWGEAWKQQQKREEQIEGQQQHRLLQEQNQISRKQPLPQQQFRPDEPVQQHVSQPELQPRQQQGTQLMPQQPAAPPGNQQHPVLLLPIQQTQRQLQQPLPSPGASGNNAGRGEAQSALASLMMLTPFATPTTADRVSATPTTPATPAKSTATKAVAAAGAAAGAALAKVAAAAVGGAGGYGDTRNMQMQQSQQQQQRTQRQEQRLDDSVISSSLELAKQLRRVLQQHSSQQQQPQETELWAQAVGDEQASANTLQQRQQQQQHLLLQQAFQQPGLSLSEADPFVVPESQDELQDSQREVQDHHQQQQLQGFQQLQLLASSSPQQQQQQPASQLQQQMVAPESITDTDQQQQEFIREQQDPLPVCTVAPGFLGPSGLTCLTLPLTSDQLLELLRQGAAFAADWSELRSVTRNRLVGKVIPPDLAAAVEAATAAAAGAGAFGVGKARYMRDIQTGDPCLPPNAKIVQVTVQYPNGRQQLVTYRQAFTGPTARLCINCFKVVPGATAPQDAVLQGGLDLVCSLDCERLYYIKNSSSGIRRALFRLERGVCQMCGLDAHALVKELQSIAREGSGWLAARKALVADRAPRFLERGCAAALERLLAQATEGNAWHADHILAVYEGGGGCDMDNLRTLCVPCHAAVTKRQAAARAAERARRKLNTHDIRHWFGGVVAVGKAGSGVGAVTRGGPAAVAANSWKRKRRGQVEGSVVFIDSDGLSPDIKPKVAGQEAGTKQSATASAVAAANAATAEPIQSVKGKVATATARASSPELICLSDSPSLPVVATANKTAGTAPAVDDKRMLKATPTLAVRGAAAAAATAAAGQGGGAGVMRSVLQQFSFSQDTEGTAGIAAAAATDQLTPCRQQQQQQHTVQGYQRAKSTRRRAGKPKPAGNSCNRSSNSSGARSISEDSGSDHDYVANITAAARKQLATAAEQAASKGIEGQTRHRQRSSRAGAPQQQSCQGPACSKLGACEQQLGQATTICQVLQECQGNGAAVLQRPAGKQAGSKYVFSVAAARASRSKQTTRAAAGDNGGSSMAGKGNRAAAGRQGREQQQQLQPKRSRGSKRTYSCIDS